VHDKCPLQCKWQSSAVLCTKAENNTREKENGIAPHKSYEINITEIDKKIITAF
jgi:hypothetical protein